MQEHLQSNLADSGKAASSAASEAAPPQFPGLPAPEVMAANLWYRSRAAVTFEEAGMTLSIASMFSASALHQEEARHVRLMAGGKFGYLAMPAKLISTILQSYGLTLGQTLPEHLILLLLEHRFAEAIEELEKRLNLPVTLTDFGTENDASDDLLVLLDAKVSLWGEDYRIRLHLPTDVAISLSKLLDTVQERRGIVWPIPVSLATRAAFAQLTLGALKTIRPGDVILADRTAGLGRAFLVAGERLAASGVWQDRAVILQERPKKIVSIDGGGWSMSGTGNLDETQAAADAELDDIQIKVLFELGRKEVPLGELRSLIPGYVFELNRDQRTAIDIYAGTRRVGCGEIVQINGALGVRVTRLFNNE